MAVPVNKPSQPPSYSERALREMENERRRDAEERITGWTVVWTLFAFKMATVALVWFAANGSRDEGSRTDSLLVATTWYWMLIPAVAVSGLVAYRLRLRAVRKRAAQLRRAEFLASHGCVESGTMAIELTDEEKARLVALQERRKNSDNSGVD
jgi:heme/copper-type cytochrome/quinol oxidase subunit 2